VHLLLPGEVRRELRQGVEGLGVLRRVQTERQINSAGPRSLLGKALVLSGWHVLGVTEVLAQGPRLRLGQGLVIDGETTSAGLAMGPKHHRNMVARRALPSFHPGHPFIFQKGKASRDGRPYVVHRRAGVPTALSVSSGGEHRKRQTEKCHRDLLGSVRDDWGVQGWRSCPRDCAPRIQHALERGNVTRLTPLRYRI